MCAMAVQPMPNGARIQWDSPLPSGWSNYSYSVWRQLPPTTNWFLLGQTNGLEWFIAGPIIPGSVFGVTATAQSNAVFRNSDMGVAAAPPDTNYGAGSLKLVGPVNALRIESSITPGGVPTLIGVYSNSPIAVAAKTREFLRTVATNFPPPPRL